MLDNLFHQVLDSYDEERASGKRDRIHKIVTRDIPNALIKDASITSEYKIQGSTGQSGWSEVPWTAVMDKSITTSTQSGFYIVYLFDSERKGFFISLALGWEQFNSKFKPVKEARMQVRRYSDLLESHLHSSLDDFIYGPIDLHAKGNLAKGYELGQICSKYYPIDSIPEDLILIDDLRNLMGVYRELKGIVGNDIFSLDPSADSAEEVYQKGVNNLIPKRLPPGPRPKGKIRSSSNSKRRYDTDANIGAAALEDANFKCEFDESHTTFTSKRTSNQFMECHHLVPMQYQDDFQNTIDAQSNIISVCPDCHRRVHLAKPEEVTPLLENIFLKRQHKLQKDGIELAYDKLLTYYDIEQ